VFTLLVVRLSLVISTSSFRGTHRLIHIKHIPNRFVIHIARVQYDPVSKRLQARSLLLDSTDDYPLLKTGFLSQTHDAGPQGISKRTYTVIDMENVSGKDFYGGK
jgi:hypothetical protein